MLAVLETHPIQYRAPVYRELQQRFNIPVTVIYGSDFSVAGYRDMEFGTTFAWDSDLLSGYTSCFLSRVAQGGACSAQAATTRGLSRALQKIAPTAIMVVGYSPRFHQRAIFHAWQHGSPVIFRGETTERARAQSPVRMWARRRALRWVYRSCAKLLYVGQASYQHFRRLGCDDEKLIFSPYCVDTTPFQCDEVDRQRLRPHARTRLGLTKAQKVILFSGKLYQGKGPHLLIRAIKALPTKSRESISVLIMGSGEMQETLEDLARCSPQVHIRFLGFQNQTQLSQYYHASDLLALPSLSETWGLVVNEALHHGLPCIVSDAVGCARDLVDPGLTGDVFENGSIHSLASALERGLALAGRPEIRAACREKMSGFTVARAAQGIARAYWNVVGERPGVPLT
ncbi:MAG: glycosyltransferase family 4 protein [Acidobacteria bacterium]|nr:glycosyltransferase family 4 protein [Acidobacteriota bacterium]MBI3657910.1 glycosyltransferase family 4 protein [Acidobacteriota bacterium]